VGDTLLGPGLPDDLDGFPEELAILLLLPRIGVWVELGALVGPHPATEADVDSSPGQIVENRQVLGQPQRMPPHGDVGHLADPEAAGPRRQVRPDDDRIGEIAEAWSRPGGGVLNPWGCGQRAVATPVEQPTPVPPSPQ
jgi:hypothetical protein